MPVAADHPLLAVRGIEKSFPGVRALAGVDLDLRAGEVLAVVGENGAGKSTLMKILAGVERADAGSIRLNDRVVAPRTVHEAIEAGVALIHQELNLAGNLDIASNICLGREPHKLGLIDRTAVRATARRSLDAVGLDEPPERRVDELAIGHRQLVEIAKAISIEARVLIMDEPTSSLTLGETERLFAVVRQLRDRGVGIIYISHRLAEVERIADRVVVLRDGRVSARLDRGAIDRETMVHHMIGRALSGYARQQRPAAARLRLEIKDFRTTAHPAATANLHVRAGEIVGIAGLVGAGRTELLESIFGIAPPRAGTVLVDGRRVLIRTPRDAIRRGLALVPEDRLLHGLIVEQTLRHNLGLAGLARHARAGFVDRGHERDTSRRMIEQLHIRAASDRQIIGTLSGGNQQKVALARLLHHDVDILCLDEPTRGVDVTSKSEIYQLMAKLVSEGKSILMVSSYLPELLGVCDRIAVMYRGELKECRPVSEWDEHRLLTAAVGGAT